MKDEVYRVAARYSLDVIVVANSWMRVPDEKLIKLEVVGGGFDEADDWIVEQVQSRDLVITSDILLAERCLKKEACVIGTTGKSFTPDNIGDAVAMRSLMADLRESGEMTGGPPPFQKSDRSNFLQEMDKVLQTIRREFPSDQ